MMIMMVTSIIFLSLWSISLSPSISLLSISGLALSFSSTLVLYTNISPIPVIMLILSIMGGLFILIAMILMINPQDYEITISKNSIVMILLISLIIIFLSGSINSLNSMEISFFSSKNYIFSFLFSMNILFLSLFVVDWVLSKFGKGYIFKG